MKSPRIVGVNEALQAVPLLPPGVIAGAWPEGGVTLQEQVSTPLSVCAVALSVTRLSSSTARTGLAMLAVGVLVTCGVKTIEAGCDSGGTPWSSTSTCTAYCCVSAGVKYALAGFSGSIDH